MISRHGFFDVFLWICGSAVFSISVNMFSAPMGIVLGGITGVSTVINHIFPFVPIGSCIFLLNIPLFVLAKLFLKKGFLLKTFFATGIFSVLIDLGAVFIKPYNGDKLLGALFCGVLSGIGLSLVFLTGATTGGTDIIAMLLRKKFTRLSMGRVILFIDITVVALSFPVYKKIESIMYALTVIFITSRVIDLVLYGSGYGKLILTVTEKSDTLSKSILHEIGRGVTILPAAGAYTGKSRNILLCAVKRAQISSVIRLVKQTDPSAFTVICDAGEIIGEGFS